MEPDTLYRFELYSLPKPHAHYDQYLALNTALPTFPGQQKKVRSLLHTVQQSSKLALVRWPEASKICVGPVKLPKWQARLACGKKSCLKKPNTSDTHQSLKRNFNPLKNYQSLHRASEINCLRCTFCTIHFPLAAACNPCVSKDLDATASCYLVAEITLQVLHIKIICQSGRIRQENKLKTF